MYGYLTEPENTPDQQQRAEMLSVEFSHLSNQEVFIEFKYPDYAWVLILNGNRIADSSSLDDIISLGYSIWDKGVEND